MTKYSSHAMYFVDDGVVIDENKLRSLPIYDDISREIQRTAPLEFSQEQPGQLKGLAGRLESSKSSE